MSVWIQTDIPHKLVGEKVEVQKHSDNVLVYYRNSPVAEHKRELELRNKKITDASHRSPRFCRKKTSTPLKEEKKLLGDIYFV